MTENPQQDCNIYWYYLQKKEDFQRQLAILGILVEPIQKSLASRRSREQPPKKGNL